MDDTDVLDRCLSRLATCRFRGQLYLSTEYSVRSNPAHATRRDAYAVAMQARNIRFRGVLRVSAVAARRAGTRRGRRGERAMIGAVAARRASMGARRRRRPRLGGALAVGAKYTRKDYGC